MPEKTPPAQKFSAKEFYSNVRNFETACETQLKQYLLQMHQAKIAMQTQAGITEHDDTHLDLLMTTLRNILAAETSEQVQTYQANFNHLLDTAHPETMVLPLNQYLESLLELTKHYEEQFAQEKDAAKIADALAVLRKNVETAERQFAARANILLDEFNRATTQQPNKNYELAIAKIKLLQTHMADAHRLVTEILPQAQTAEHLQQLRQELRHMTDAAHHAAAVDSQASEAFLNNKNKCKKIATTLCDVRTAYLQTESEKNTEAALETTLEISWQALQAVGGFVPGAGVGFQYIAPTLAGLDSTKSIAETTENKSSPWWKRLGTVAATAAAVLSIAAIIVFPPLAIAAAIVAGVSIAYAVGTGVKEYAAKKTHKNNAVANQSNQQAAALDDHLRAKTKLREQRAAQHDQLSSEAKMEMLLTGHKPTDTLSAQEKANLQNKYAVMVEQDNTTTEATSVPTNKPNTPAPQAKPEPQLAAEVIKDYFSEPKEEDVPKLGE